jgi:hypothetical protein
MSLNPDIKIQVGTDLTKIDIFDLAHWEARERGRLYYDERVCELLDELYNNTKPDVDWTTVFINALVEKAINDVGVESNFATAVAAYLQVREYLDAKAIDNEVKRIISQDHSWEALMSQAQGGQPFKSGVSNAIIGEKMVTRNDGSDHTIDWTITQYLENMATVD